MSTTFEVSEATFQVERLLADVTVQVGAIDFAAAIYPNGEVTWGPGIANPLAGEISIAARAYVLEALRRQFAALDALEARETRASEFTQHAQRPPEFGAGGAL